MDLKNYIASIEDFPKKGIIFRDITPLIENAESFSYAVNQIKEFAKSKGATVIAGPEARGFIFGCPTAKDLGLGFVSIRKPGKLPRAQITESYNLEYGSNTLCIHADSLKPGDKVVIVDDLLATGGTALAAAHLCEKAGATVVGMAFVIDLIDLKGREVLRDYDVFTLVEYEGE